MKLSEELTKRGFVNQISSDSLEIILDEEKRVVYHGIEPTAESAHAGNFVVWMLLKHLVNHGHKVIFLVGGGTGMIGDPKPDAERELQDREVVAGRALKIKAQAEKILGAESVTFVDNYEWLSKINLIEFLRDVGKHFTINELIKRDAISKRLSSETGLSYTEFAYPLLQAYDFLKLYKENNCTLQVGGSDQWGNIVSGVDLIRRVEKGNAYGLTVPLIIDKATGKKFGKSEGNAVWLDEKLTSSYDLYQFWYNVSDESVIDYLKLFTLLPLDEIAEIETRHKNAPEERCAQEALASEIVAFVHSKESAEFAKKVTAVLFGREELKNLNPQQLDLVKRNAPKSKISNNENIVEVLLVTGLADSKREARGFIEAGAIWIDDIQIKDSVTTLDKSIFGDLSVIKRGKKKRALIEIE